jgi:Cu(I)/Ag(I) efflux system membrane fusion protein
MTLVPNQSAKAKPSPISATMAAPVPGLSAIELSPERVQLVGMLTAPVKREALTGDLRTVGVVTPSERGLAQINTRFSGWIDKLFVSGTGDRVRRGQVLATVYSPEVLKAEQELLVARGWTAPAAGGARGAANQDGFAAGFDENARRRLELLGISSQEVEQVLRSGKPTEAIPIRSPVEGYVVAKSAVAGVAVQPGTVLFEVADLSTVWVTADVYEADVARVRIGQPARLELAAYPGQIFGGKVKFIYPIIDAQNRTLRVRLEFKNRFDSGGPRLRPGMYGTVYLSLPATSGLTVPAEAVVDTGEMHYLFVARGSGHFEPRQVKVGARAQGKVVVLSGVSEGEMVVTTGNFMIDSESRLRSAIDGRNAAEPIPGPSRAGR